METAWRRSIPNSIGYTVSPCCYSNSIFQLLFQSHYWFLKKQQQQQQKNPFQSIFVLPCLPFTFSSNIFYTIYHSYTHFIVVGPHIILCCIISILQYLILDRIIFSSYYMLLFLLYYPLSGLHKSLPFKFLLTYKDYLELLFKTKTNFPTASYYFYSFL